MIENKTKTSNLMAEVFKNNQSDFPVIQTNRLYEAKVIKIIGKEAYFDLGKFGLGIVYGAEFNNSKDIIKNLHIGDKVFVKYLGEETPEGYLEVSLTEADKMKTITEIKELKESGDLVKVKVIGVARNGLIVDLLKNKAFLPIAQLSLDHYQKISEFVIQEDWQKISEVLQTFVGEEFNVKVTGFNSRNQRITVSEREILPENAKELIANYSIGQVVDVIVSGFADFGIFVQFADNPQLEGIIYTGEISYRYLDNPKDVISLNENLKAKIINIKDNRIILSLKALEQNPWENIEEKIKIGQKINGQVYRSNSFGTLVNFDNNLQGLVPSTEFQSLDEMKKSLQIGQTYQFIVSDIKPTEQRIFLKLAK
jgi:small subunit ribosomal protein S1